MKINYRETKPEQKLYSPNKLLVSGFRLIIELENH